MKYIPPVKNELIWRRIALLSRIVRDRSRRILKVSVTNFTHSDRSTAIVSSVSRISHILEESILILYSLNTCSKWLSEIWICYRFAWDSRIWRNPISWPLNPYSCASSMFSNESPVYRRRLVSSVYVSVKWRGDTGIDMSLYMLLRGYLDILALSNESPFGNR
jgi:hypothetical protein